MNDEYTRFIAFYEQELAQLEADQERIGEEEYQQRKRAIEWNLGAMRALYASTQERVSNG